MWRDLEKDFRVIVDKHPGIEKSNNVVHLGTLGTGNHFIEVCLDTEDAELAELADDLSISWLKRPEALASNATDGHEMFAWQCSQRPDADLWVQLPR